MVNNMGIIKRIMHVFNGNDWDEYYPKTSSDQVVHTQSDGTQKTVEEVLNESSNVIYSTQPIEIGKTQDGRKIYRKTIKTEMTYFTKPTSGYNIATISLGTKATEILNFKATIYDKTGRFYMLPYSGTGNLGTWLKSIYNVNTNSHCVIEFLNNVKWGSNYVLSTTVDYTVD